MYTTLVGAVSQISEIMGIATIAEEVDDLADLEKLRGLGVLYAQGDAVAPPQSFADTEGLLAVPCYERS